MDATARLWVFCCFCSTCSGAAPSQIPARFSAAKHGSTHLWNYWFHPPLKKFKLLGPLLKKLKLLGPLLKKLKLLVPLLKKDQYQFHPPLNS
ncbi:hypothetical protein METBIDRAFT_187366 [Metschnikowia bicuspidata var. bicuspidata NRRL YB-4993]|uniref:Secreted protein n=1 Tax=Metschnikowia bicuspidata var. bicuspidata NRRL YB-4993 TaxID=869754 RepID=A0A1A0HC20_9ASCO|nr:hypothetical protein METBIDRAFT_187366 [Metschnikowia bicuspidata var. bicuspidata NRRL YB-4993]OBA21530.1 hypothetical protein METBIDRAFT_187366 [Metschnikowia bicuspidata var. bicuspidata NRRL YB-4993]